MELENLNLSDEQLAGVKQLLQSEGDKIRTKYSNELRAVREELNQYKPAQKSDAEIQFENRMKDLEAREQKLLAKERETELSSKLNELGLPTELGQYLNLGDDVDAGLQAVSVAINGYLLNNGSKPTNHSKQQSVSKADFKKMSYGEKAQLFQENLELYKALAR
ncbi:hypothetical protein [Anaerostipes faecalis]|uniref:hypothetical protein n=1 Tax=Anaerostipes faecalis TaxID=2738446 RepID=UPI003F07AFF1